ANRGPEAARVHVLPTLWARNTWSWGRTGEGYGPKAVLAKDGNRAIVAQHATLGGLRLYVGPGPDGGTPELLFTANQKNTAGPCGAPNASAYVKDAFHEYVVRGRKDAVNPAATGSKAAAHYVLDLPAGAEVVLRLRLAAEQVAAKDPLGPRFDAAFDDRR